MKLLPLWLSKMLWTSDQALQPIALPKASSSKMKPTSAKKPLRRTKLDKVTSENIPVATPVAL